MVQFFFLFLFIYGWYLINGIHYGKSISRSLSDCTVLLVITKDNLEVGYCGGNLLSNKLLVTAAHCVGEINSGKQINIMKGFKSLPFLINKQMNEEVVKILWIEIHPLYIKYSLSASYDIALIGIDEIVSFCSKPLGSPSIAILPFNLNNGENIVNNNFNNCFITGHGRDENGFLTAQSKGIIFKKPLLKKYKNNKTFIGYYENLIFEKEKFDEGDSGNGLYCEKDNKIYLIGIASSCYYKNKIEKIIDINTFTIIFTESIKLFIRNIIKRKHLMNDINKMTELCFNNNNSMMAVYNNLLEK